MNFTELSLDDSLAKGIVDAGYETCTPVQEQVLSGAMEGADLYVQSQTGTGKTAAYLITVFQQLLANAQMKGKKALVMVPTRELAVQVEEEANILGKHTGIKSASFYGGVGYERQKQQLAKGVDIIIGTPGRIIDLQEGGSMDLGAVAFLVVDEADRMFDMGFYPDLRKLIKVLPGTQERQTMLFSATLNTYVKNLAWEYTEDAKEITIECEHITVSEIDQLLYHVSSDEKMKLLLGILSREKPESVIIFCNTKRMSEVVAKRLQHNGIECEFIIGDLPQSKRLQVIDSFKKGSLKCLVATDVAARGIDVDNLAMVVNFDLPNESENYVHRIGRTARAGRKGKAYTFCSEQDVYSLPPIERYIEMNIPAEVADESLMAEDKSAGLYIKTSSYYEDERGERRYGRGRDERRPRGEGRGGPRGERRGSRDGYRGEGRDGSRGDGRGGERRSYQNRGERDFGRRLGEGGRRYNANGGYKRGGKPYDESRGYQRQEAEELSSLSFEERMEVYKQKYAGQNPAAPNGAPNESRAKPQGGRRDGRNNRRSEASANGGYQRGEGRGGSRSNNGGEYRGNRRYDERARANQQPRADVQTQPQVQPSANEGAAAKQGFFSKLKGLFSKK